MLFKLSTKIVYNFVDKQPLIAGSAIFRAVFYKLLKWKAQNFCRKIKDLQSACHETYLMAGHKVVALHNFDFVNK